MKFKKLLRTLAFALSLTVAANAGASVISTQMPDLDYTQFGIATVMLGQATLVFANGGVPGAVTTLGFAVSTSYGELEKLAKASSLMSGSAQQRALKKLVAEDAAQFLAGHEPSEVLLEALDQWQRLTHELAERDGRFIPLSQLSNEDISRIFVDLR